jgi:hypothetical protein
MHFHLLLPINGCFLDIIERLFRQPEQIQGHNELLLRRVLLLTTYLYLQADRHGNCALSLTCTAITVRPRFLAPMEV